MKKLPNSRRTISGDASLRDHLRTPLSKAEVKNRVLGMTAEVGLLAPYKLASWFVEFIHAPTGTLKKFHDQAKFIASTKGASAIEENLTDQDFQRVRSDIHDVIGWTVDGKPTSQARSLAPIDPFSVDILPYWEGAKIEKCLVPRDFRGRLLLRLFDLFSKHVSFRRCRNCDNIFARRGRRIYCGSACAEKVRPDRRVMMRHYMKKRRDKIKRLEIRAPALAEKVKQGKMRLQAAIKQTIVNDSQR